MQNLPLLLVALLLDRVFVRLAWVAPRRVVWALVVMELVLPPALGAPVHVPAMPHSEGDLTPDGKALITYGTLDEYLTGEHDKMVRYVWRFVNADKIVLEVHDMPIGEENTQVISFTYTRAK